MRPQADDYPAYIEAAIRALLDRGFEAGAEALAPIAYLPREIERRRSVPRSVLGQVMRRDCFRCRYCDGKVIPASIMELLGGVYPDSFPFHPNWKGGVTHPALISRSAMVDHITPGSAGGAWLDAVNLATACNPCNSIKADFTLEQLGWELRPITDDGWDGLVSLYRPLWDAAGRPKPKTHEVWLAVLSPA